MKWSEIGRNLSEQIQEADLKSRDVITPEQALTNAQLAFTSKAFAQACGEHRDATESDIISMRKLCEDASRLPITPYEKVSA